MTVEESTEVILGLGEAPAATLSWANPTLRRMAWTGLGLAVTGAVALTASATVSRLPDFEWRLRPALLAASAVAFLALQLSHAALWRRLLRELGHDVDARRCRAIWSTSGLARYTPGSLLMPMVRVAMLRPEGVSKRAGLASFIYEMALLLTAAVLVGAYAVLETAAFGGPLRVAILAIPAAALVSLHPRIFGPVANAALRRAGREPLPSLLGLPALALYVALYAATWLLAGAGLYLLLEGVHPIAPDDVLIVLVAPSVGYIAAVIGFMAPGGLGAREAGLAAALSVALPVAVAVAIAVALRLMQLLVELGCAVVTPILARGR